MSSHLIKKRAEIRFGSLFIQSSSTTAIQIADEFWGDREKAIGQSLDNFFLLTLAAIDSVFNFPVH
ncbi:MULTISPECIES: hypothetical protein [unclassified Chamaesiphon]|uniref:hypothetical protein n=1 Tax=unclassified Chamaesiphon TaxID=2620921 RepID=UPI00286CEF5F|nr:MULTISPECIES: hypothetical protein [unclassified Chamaesiphon]